MEPSIILYEPQCTGYSHASFNAALLQTVLVAYPGATVTFRAETEHLRWVRDALEQHLGPTPDRLVWDGTSVPPKRVTGPVGLIEHRRAAAATVQQAARPGVELLLLCSLSSVGLWALKGALHGRPTPAPIVGVFHGALSGLLGTRSRNPVNWWLTPRRALGRPHPPGLRYVALGGSILRSLERLVPEHSGHFSALDIPTLWEALPNRRRPGDPVRFAYFGVGRTGLKGFELFCRLAADMGDAVTAGRCEFVLVGFLRDKAAHGIPGLSNIGGVGTSPLSPDEYKRRAASTTYAIWPGQSAEYVLRASASFVDTLCMGRPGLYLRAPFVEGYCTQMGDIGFLCDDYDQMLQTVRSVVDDFAEDRYRRQCASVIEGAKAFRPDTLAAGLKAIVDGCKQELAKVR